METIRSHYTKNGLGFLGIRAKRNKDLQLQSRIGKRKKKKKAEESLWALETTKRDGDGDEDRQRVCLCGWVTCKPRVADSSLFMGGLVEDWLVRAYFIISPVSLKWWRVMLRPRPLVAMGKLPSPAFCWTRLKPQESMTCPTRFD